LPSLGSFLIYYSRGLLVGFTTGIKAGRSENVTSAERIIKRARLSKSLIVRIVTP
jgi:hypothetical protein